MEKIADRFNSFLSTKQLNPNSLARSIGKSYTAIKSIVDGKSKPGYDILEAMFEKYPELSPDWLMKGEGEMFRTEIQEQPRHFGQEVTERIEQYFQVQLREKDKQIEQHLHHISELTQMLKSVLPGKTEGAIVRPLLPVKPVLQVAV